MSCSKSPPSARTGFASANLCGPPIPTTHMPSREGSHVYGALPSCSSSGANSALTNP